MDADAATRDEQSDYLDVTGIHQLNKVVEDDVDHIFMEITVISEGEEIQLQALALHHFLIRDIQNLDFTEVGLAGDRAKRGELRAVELHPVVALRMTVFEGFEDLRCVGLRDLGLVAQ